MQVKRLLIILSACIMTCISFLFSGCTNPWDVKKEENGFYYVLCDENGEFTKHEKKAVGAIILGRVNNDEFIDELAIPQKLGGYPVKQIGEYYHPIEGEDHSYRIDCKNIGKIVINHPCNLKDAFWRLSGELVINADVAISSVSQFIPYSYNTVCKLIRFDVDLKSLTDYETWLLLWDYDWGIPSERQLKMIEFNAVGGLQRTYAYVVQTNTCIIRPKAPTKTGYTFAGWFDENYETEWDFETGKVTENTALYAKWIENPKENGV